MFQIKNYETMSKLAKVMQKIISFSGHGVHMNKHSGLILLFFKFNCGEEMQDIQKVGTIAPPSLARTVQMWVKYKSNKV